MDLAASLDDPLATFVELKRRARAVLVDPGGAIAWVDRWLERLGRDPLATLPLGAQRDAAGVGAVLHDGPAVRVTAELRYPAAVRATVVVAPGRLTYVRFVRAGGGVLSLWRVPAGEGMDRAMRLGDVPLTDDQLLTLDGRTRAWGVGEADAPVVSLSATIRVNAAATIRQYAAADGRLLRAATLDAGAARAELLLGVLRATRHLRTAALLAAMTRDEAHFLRWSAMREWLLHDRADALPRLREMAATDRDDEVRRAAGRTLDRWPGGEAALCPA